MAADKRPIQEISGRELSIEIGANLLIEPYGTPTVFRFKTSFVGMDKGRYIVTRLPLNKKAFDYLPHLRPVTIRFLMSGGVICGFESKVLHIMVKPFPLLFLQYPDVIERLSLRLKDRASCFLAASVFHGNDEDKGAVLNISEGGCKVVLEMNPDLYPGDSGESRIPSSLENDQEVMVKTQLFGLEEDVMLPARVKGACFVTPSKISMGLAFDTLAQEYRTAITDYVASVRQHLMD